MNACFQPSWFKFWLGKGGGLFGKAGGVPRGGAFIFGRVAFVLFERLSRSWSIAQPPTISTMVTPTRTMVLLLERGKNPCSSVVDGNSDEEP